MFSLYFCEEGFFIFFYKDVMLVELFVFMFNIWVWFIVILVLFCLIFVIFDVKNGVVEIYGWIVVMRLVVVGSVI